MYFFVILSCLNYVFAEELSHVNIKVYFTDLSVKTYTVWRGDPSQCQIVDFPKQDLTARIGAITAEYKIASTDEVKQMEFTLFPNSEGCPSDALSRQIKLPAFAPGWDSDKMRSIDAGGEFTGTYPGAGTGTNQLLGGFKPRNPVMESESDYDSELSFELPKQPSKGLRRTTGGLFNLRPVQEDAMEEEEEENKRAESDNEEFKGKKSPSKSPDLYYGQAELDKQVQRLALDDDADWDDSSDDSDDADARENAERNQYSRRSNFARRGLQNSKPAGEGSQGVTVLQAVLDRPVSFIAEIDIQTVKGKDRGQRKKSFDLMGSNKLYNSPQEDNYGF